MKKLAKILVFVLVAAMAFTACFALVGCNGNTVKVATYTMFGEGDGHRTGWLAAMKEFNDNGATIKNEKGDDVKVKVQIEDRSKWTNDYDTQVANDLNTKNGSDLIYGFTGARSDTYTGKTMNVSDIKAKLAEINSGIDYAPKAVVQNGDLTTAGWKQGFQMGIIYNTDKNWAAADFATIEAFEAKLATNVAAGGKIADYGSEPNTYFNMYAAKALGDKIVSGRSIDKAWWETNEAGLKIAIEKTLNFAKTAKWVASGSQPTTADQKIAMAKGEVGLIAEGSWAIPQCIKEYKLNADGSAWENVEGGAALGDKAKFAALPGMGEYAFTGIDHGWQINKQVVEKKANKKNNYAKLQVISQLVNWCYTNSQKFVDGGAGGVYLNNSEGKQAGVIGDAADSIVGKKAVLPVENRLSTAAGAALFKDGIIAGIQTGKTDAAYAATIYNNVKAAF